MEASAAYLQLPCFLSGTPLRAGSTVKSTPGRLRTILATAEPAKPKVRNRRRDRLQWLYELKRWLNNPNLPNQPMPCALNSGLPRRMKQLRSYKHAPGHLQLRNAETRLWRLQGPDRRGAIASLAGLFAGASFMGVAEAAIDSSALLERYQAAKGSGSPTKSIVKAPAATPQTPPPATTPAKTTKAASAGT